MNTTVIGISSIQALFCLSLALPVEAQELSIGSSLQAVAPLLDAGASGLTSLNTAGTIGDNLGSVVALEQSGRDSVLGEGAGIAGDSVQTLGSTMGLAGEGASVVTEGAGSVIGAASPVISSATQMTATELASTESMAGAGVDSLIRPEITNLAQQTMGNTVDVVQAAGQTVSVTNVGNGSLGTGPVASGNQISDLLALTRGNGTLVGNVDNSSHGGSGSSGEGSGGGGGDSGQGGFLFSNSGNAGGGGNGGQNVQKGKH